MKRLAIVQARMGSTRLPGKVLMDVWGRSLLERHVQRLRMAKLDAIVVAIPEGDKDDALAGHVKGIGGVELYRGPEHDVLARYYGAAFSRRDVADVIIRTTADEPFIEPKVVDAVADQIPEKDGHHFACNNIEKTFPHGLDCEAFTWPVLHDAQLFATLPADREHVSPWMRRRRGIHKWNVVCPQQLGFLRLTVDTEKDMELCREIWRAFRDEPWFTLGSVTWLLNRRPDLLAMADQRVEPAGGDDGEAS